MKNIQPSLFGLNKPNRDLTQREIWGKNQFNSSFPAALCFFLASKNMQANYLAISNGKLNPSLIPIKDVFGIKADDKGAYFAFESQHTPYQKFVVGSRPRTDLVIQKESTGECLSGLEVKLTALPDNTTCDLDEGLYGSEIVVRPDTIVYLTCSIAAGLSEKLGDILPTIKINDWSEAFLVLAKIDSIVTAIESLSVALEKGQNAFLLQPIWKTIEKSPELAENCLDMFVWNDKAFASAGNVTNKYMSCQRVVKPIIKKSEIKEIILGGGQNLLSPERRFDAILFNSPGLFV